MKRIILILLLLMPSLAHGMTYYYVDGDWGGTQSGTASQPWSSLTSGAWTTINTALESDNVTVYFNALLDNGSAGETYTAEIRTTRETATTYRLTLDGHAKYNTTTYPTATSWSDNPTAIGTAYYSGKVAKINKSSGSLAIGHGRNDGAESVIHNSTYYTCISSHVSGSTTEPGVGANWQDVWVQRGSSGAAWATSTNYHTYNKQDYMTYRGWEVTGASARSMFAGSYTILEYFNVHDITSDGPAVNFWYTFLDSSGETDPNQRRLANCHDITFRHFRIKNSYGEALYLGSLPIELSSQLRCSEGNGHHDFLIEDFLIENSGTNGGQGDGIDFHLGMYNITIRDGEISGWNNSVAAMHIAPAYGDTGMDNNILVEDVYLHDGVSNGDGLAIYFWAQDETYPCDRAMNNVTIRNIIIDTVSPPSYACLYIGGSGQSNASIRNQYIYNNTIYGCGNVPINIADADNNTNVRNNLLFNNNSNGNQCSIDTEGSYTCSHNAYYGSFTPTCSSCISMTSTQRDNVCTNPASGDFTLKDVDSIAVDNGTTLSGFSDDFIDTSRPQGSVWDISAYEFIQGSPPSGEFRFSGSSFNGAFQ